MKTGNMVLYVHRLYIPPCAEVYIIYNVYTVDREILGVKNFVKPSLL